MIVSGLLGMDPATGDFVLNESGTAIIDLSDAMIFAMTVVNITALYFLMSIIKRGMRSYFGRLKSGEIVRHKP